MSISSADVWIVLVGAAAGVACAVCGTFLVLRRLSMLGDAISHAVLPGIAGAFLLSGSRNYAPMFAGALGTGVLTALGAGWIRRVARLDEETSLGIVLSTFFALGVVLVTFAARSVDLDPGCVLYGLIEYTPFETVSVLGQRVPRAFVVLAPTALAVCLLATFALPTLRMAAFDPGFVRSARAARGFEVGLLVATAVVTVASFEAVGSILVVAMLVAPGAAALQLTDRLGRALAISAAIAVASAVAGYALALAFDSSVAGMMSVATCGFFAIAAIAAPRHGALARLRAHERLARRIAEEDILGLLWRRDEGLRTIGAGESVGALLLKATRGGRRQRAALRALLRTGLVQPAPRATGGAPTAETALELTPAGRARAGALVRGHRLWERYLDSNTALAPDHLHAPSDRVEHFLTPAMREQLAREAGEGPDPHGRTLPPSTP